MPEKELPKMTPERYYIYKIGVDLNAYVKGSWGCPPARERDHPIAAFVDPAEAEKFIAGRSDLYIQKVKI